MFHTKSFLLLGMVFANTQASSLQSRTSGSNTCDLNGQQYVSTGRGGHIFDDDNSEFTIGVKVSEENGVFNVTQDYYLSLPYKEDPSSPDRRVCFLFFHPKDDLPNEYPGNCGDYVGMSPECTKGLLPDIDTWHFGGEAAEADCEALGQRIQDNPPEACNLKPGWGNVTASTFPSANTYSIATAGNGGQCWPTARGNNLYHLGSFTRTTRNKTESNDHLYATTPIFNYYYPTDGIMVTEGWSCMSAEKPQPEDDTRPDEESGSPISLSLGNLLPILGVTLAILSHTRGWM